jgi:hypothetical protein
MKVFAAAMMLLACRVAGAQFGAPAHRSRRECGEEFEEERKGGALVLKAARICAALRQ